MPYNLLLSIKRVMASQPAYIFSIYSTFMSLRPAAVLQRASYFLNFCGAHVYCPDFVYVQFFGSIITVNAVLFLFHIGQLGITETAHLWVVQKNFYQSLISIVKLFF